MAAYSTTFKAFLTLSTGDTTILLPGSNVLGRGNEFGIHDRRVSRRHAEIVVNPQTATVTIEPLGVNPTWITRKGAKHQIPNNEREVLRTGDVICLLDFQFTVIIVDEGVSKMSTGTATLGSDQDAATQLDVDAFEDEDEHETTAEVRSNKTIGAKRKADDDAESQGKRSKSDSVKVNPSEIRYILKTIIEELEGEQLGIGSCGEVWEGEWRGTRVAVKKIFRSLLHADAIKEFDAEVQILGSLRHPNIVLFMGTCTQEKELAIVTEFMSRGSLRDVLDSASIVIDLRMIIKISNPLDAATGMNYLHTYSPPIIHRDLKSMNLLVDNNFNVKVSDFGLARFSNKNIKNTTFCGTLQWIAPELLLGVGYTTQVDVYSYGVVLWELITRREPYKGKQQADIISGVTGKGMRPEIPENCPQPLAQLIRNCWESEPQNRPSFSEIIGRLREMEAALPPPPSPSKSPLSRSQQATPQGAACVEIDAKEVENKTQHVQNESSRVYRGKWRGHDVAVKELVRNKQKQEQDQLLEFKKEAEVLTTIKSPLVVFFYGAILQPLSLVMEWMECSLFDLMVKGNTNLQWTWSKVTWLALEATKAVNSLHCWKPPVVHRKLKPTNLLLDGNFHIKVSGFGLARVTQTNEPTPLPSGGQSRSAVYKAPEVLQSQTYSTKSDVYSLGIIFWELANRCAAGAYQVPFQEFTLQTEAGFTQALVQGLRPTLKHTLPPSFVTVITRCWDGIPVNRPTSSELIILLQEASKDLANK